MVFVLTLAVYLSNDTGTGGGEGAGGTRAIGISAYSISAFDCTVNVIGARKLGGCLTDRVGVSATGVTRFVRNFGTRLATRRCGGLRTCRTKLRVHGRMGRRVVPKLGGQVTSGSSVGMLGRVLFARTFNGVLAKRGASVDLGRTRALTRGRVGCCRRAGVRQGCNSGQHGKRIFLGTGTGGSDIGALPSNIRCGVLGGNGKTVPATASAIGIGCRKHLISKAMFSDSCGHGAPASFNYGRIIGK